MEMAVLGAKNCVLLASNRLKGVTPPICRHAGMRPLSIVGCCQMLSFMLSRETKVFCGPGHVFFKTIGYSF